MTRKRNHTSGEERVILSAISSAPPTPVPSNHADFGILLDWLTRLNKTPQPHEVILECVCWPLRQSILSFYNSENFQIRLADKATHFTARKLMGLVRLWRRATSDHKKGKSVPLQAWSGPEGSRKLRFPDFMTTAQGGGKVVSLTHRPPLPPGNTPGTHFC